MYRKAYMYWQLTFGAMMGGLGVGGVGVGVGWGKGEGG